MKHNWSKISIFLLILTVFIVPFLFSKEHMIYGSDPSILHQPRVVFEHDDHNDLAGVEACDICHHDYSDLPVFNNDDYEEKDCAECHIRNQKLKTTSLMTVMHKSCKGCHMDMQKGPVLCGECHRKE